MKYLIVNGDDFGASRGINRGILEAHRRGILTSTSLLVRTPWSEEAAGLSRATPELSVGLHVDLGKELKLTAGSLPWMREELRRQFARFQELTDRRPTHLDSHHNVHRDPQALPLFLELAAEHGLPMREHSPVRYFSKFYGQWGGKTHLEQLSVESLARMLETEIDEGFNELSCHPGYADPDYPTGYSGEREAELRTLCDPRIREALAAESIQLVSYHDLAKFVVNAPT
jgi:chitin disaccharide deacetylase